MAGKNIESVLLEERSFPPPREFTAKAGLKAADVRKLQEAAAADNAGFWADQARKELGGNGPSRSPWTIPMRPTIAGSAMDSSMFHLIVWMCTWPSGVTRLQSF